MSYWTMRSARATLGLSALALVTAGLAVTSPSGGSPLEQVSGGTDPGGLGSGYINYVAPRPDQPFDEDVKVNRRTGKVTSTNRGGALAQAYEVDRKNARGNPTAERELGRLEAKAQRTGKSPKEIKGQYKGAKSTQEARLLTILVEFDDTAVDDFSDAMVPATVFGDRTCVAGTAQSGPLHNNIPDPAAADHPDNNSMWVPDFSSEHFNKMLYTDEGITDRVRTDLTGPDGQPGFDISGYTMKSMYEEMSQGAYTVTGAATPWITVPHSEAWYGASRCTQDETGAWVAPAPQDMKGHPDNPAGPGSLPIDAVTALAEQDPDFPFADYDIEDQGDVDGDGNYYEPDGIIDHVVLVHAGEDKSGGGGAQGTYSIWAHSSAVPGGAEIPGTGLKVSNYIVQPEDSGVGVFAHEYGHDLGLPDLYDTSGNADSDVDFWDLMSSGSHSGPIFQSMPTHMGLWDKWVLGWVDPVQINPGSRPRDVIVGQTAKTPRGTADGIKVNLPNKTITLAEPHSGEAMWYSGADQDWADVRLARTVDVPAGGDVRFWMWNDYVIEEDWDYGFVELSTDGGATWSEQKVFDESGSEVSTPDGYGDPNSRMHDYGAADGGEAKQYGLTGHTDGWRHDYIDLSSHAGTTVQVRLRLATDAAYLDRGWFVDDLAVTADGATTWSDDAETDGDWSTEVATFVDTTGAGWHRDSGTSVKAQYYLVEWRNYSGFDEGLKYGYDTSYSDGAWKVEKIAYNAPGALIWYRDTTYGNSNQVTANSFAMPSVGSKGGLLVVDSHYDPLRRTGAGATADPSTLKNMPSRAQSSNAAFGLVPTKAFNECVEAPGEPFSEYCTAIAAQAPVSTFRDNLTWYPGLEFRGGGLYYRDNDASVVVPSVGNQLYSTRVVNPDGSPALELYGAAVNGFPLGSGNPGDDGVGYGTVIQVVEAKKGNVAAKIRVTAPTP